MAALREPPIVGRRQLPREVQQWILSIAAY
jgi:hypothetical protein